MLDAVTLTSTTETTTAIVISSLNLLRFWRLWSGFVCGESHAKWFRGRWFGFATVDSVAGRIHGAAEGDPRATISTRGVTTVVQDLTYENP